MSSSRRAPSSLPVGPPLEVRRKRRARGLRETIELSKLALNAPHVFAMDSGQQGVETEGKWGTQFR
jgi:hypothetical protein